MAGIKTYQQLVLALFLLTNSMIAIGQKDLTLFEKSGGNKTPEYKEIINWWKNLDEKSSLVKMQAMGITDAGFPLHLITVSNDGDFNFASARKKNKRIILINNGIHPGEPDGIDATMMLVRDIHEKRYKLPNNIVLAIIPVYNIGGTLNRSANFRVDQNGPDEFGFRGNSQNLDLNRDFIKNDSRDARAFTEIFHLTDPDVFVDNHVSNGADYQHVMTLLTTQHNKLGGAAGEFMNKYFEPGIYALMKEKGYDLIPYVNSFGDTPEKGWPEFWDSPRYGSGYAALWHTFSFVPETHMLKPYKQRVDATYALMQSFIKFTSDNSGAIKEAREKSKQAAITQLSFPIRWQHDKTAFRNILYKGYTSGQKPSEVSGLPRLYYDRSKPFEKEIPFYNQFKPLLEVEKPKAYIIPQGWWKVIELLKLNKVKMQPLERDTLLEVEAYRITDYKTSPRQYEMHHINSDVKVRKDLRKVAFRKGDLIIPMNQVANRFVIEVLEPQAEDSYFAWNYFDAILSQKEGFSSYVFEETAAELLKNNPDLKAKLDQRRASDTTFAKSARAQLGFVYENSKYYEPVHMQYPVYRLR